MIIKLDIAKRLVYYVINKSNKRRYRDMKKREALRDFRVYELPEVIKQFRANDKPAIRTAWHQYTDALCKDGLITQRQYDTWISPFK